MSALSRATSPAQPPRADFGAWWMLGVLFLLYVFSFLARIAINILVPSIKADLHVSDTQISLILGPAFALSYAVFGLPLGWLSDRFSRRWVIFLGVSVFGIATVASGLGASFASLLIARMVVGIGEASLSPPAYSLLADRFPKRLLSLAISIYTMGIKIGSASALAISGYLLAVSAKHGLHLPLVGALRPWQAVLVLSGLPAVPLALLAFTFRDPGRSAAVDRPNAGHASDETNLWRYLAKDWRLVTPLIVGFGMIGLMGYGINAWAPTYMSRAFGWKALQVGSALGSLNFICAFSLIFTGATIDWLYARGMRDAHLRFYIWMLAIAVPVLAYMFFAPNPAIFLLLFAVFLIVALPIMAYISTILQLITPAPLRGQMTAFFLFVMTAIGGSAGPVVVAWLTDSVFHDEHKVGASMAILGVTTAVLALGLLLTALRPLRQALAVSETEVDSDARLVAEIAPAAP